MIPVIPVSGQVFVDGGMKLAATSERISVGASVTARDSRCGVNTQLLEAEAERAFRRDGLDVGRPTSTALRIAVITLPSTSVAGLFRGCVASLTIQLLTVLSTAPETVLLAADDGKLFVSGLDGAHVGQLRSGVEESVSVIANRVRRLRDDARPNQ